MLKLVNVSKYYAKNGIITFGLTEVNLKLKLGEFVVITGESGSGKSTLLNILSGLDTYNDGEIYINGLETSHYTESDYLNYRRKYVSNVFQNFNLVNSYTVYDNILLALLMDGKSNKECKDIVLSTIEKVGLIKYKNTLVSKLSGGQKQKVAIARAIVCDTPIVVCDEPTGSLDSDSSKEIIKLLYEISKNKLIIVVTHNKEEIECYATRIIKMHDGKISEDNVIKKINLGNNVTEKEIKNINYLNIIKLGIKNAFNLKIKCILLLMIFLLISIALITNFGIFQASKYESNTMEFNNYFKENNKRIIIKKNNNSAFDVDDFNKIKNIKGISDVVENDLLLDTELNLYNNNLSFSGSLEIKKFDKVDLGRLPKRNEEIVMVCSKENWNIENLDKNIFSEKFSLEINNSGYLISDIKIVGIVYDNNMSSFNFYLNEKLFDMISLKINESYFDISYKINGKYIKKVIDGIKIYNKLGDGEVIINDVINSYCNNFLCLNDDLLIEFNNIYVYDSKKFKVKKVFNKNNVEKMINLNYKDANNYIFVSEKDYNELFDQNNYQSSVIVDDWKDLDNVNKTLNDMGYKTFKIKDTVANNVNEIIKVLKILELIITIVLIITVFFITYFIIKIIYKSRHSYYATLRSLGATKKVCISILGSELTTFASISYLIFLLFVRLVNKNILKIDYLKEITKYLSLSEYLSIYIIIILLSIIISLRYGRKIFKSSIINNYEEVIE